ncbi:putative protein V2 [Bifidobacterium gallicum DSM 20093 = LMG 11596]|uniref:Uncharacterized protein n=1 Tax=Bifidobacterium gallicum DSM 20093 = LMG 11596 TaxID=561180 RepID=A0A087ALV7_9BIFI|nr:putative protein V2 [Bifidobacterium gallicum DSM 20093 = LMG 11596]
MRFRSVDMDRVYRPDTTGYEFDRKCVSSHRPRKEKDGVESGSVVFLTTLVRKDAVLEQKVQSP